MNKPTSIRQDWEYSKIALTAVIGLWVVYILLTFLSPQTTNSRFNLNSLQTNILRLTIAIPYLLIWLTAISGIVAIKHYANLIDGGIEAKGIRLIATGLLWSLFYLIAIAVLGALVPYLAKTPMAYVMLAIRNHAPTLAALVGAYFLYRGSSDLRAVAKFTTWSRATPWLFALYATFAAVLAISFYFSPTDAIGSTGLPVYVWPPGVLLFTLILPSLAAWFLALLASVNILKYARRVRGVIYQQALRDLVRGIWAITFFSILLQAFFMINPLIQKANLGTILLLIYVLLGLYAIGFIFVKSGAKKLTRIEVAS